MVKNQFHFITTINGVRNALWIFSDGTIDIGFFGDETRVTRWICLLQDDKPFQDDRGFVEGYLGLAPDLREAIECLQQNIECEHISEAHINRRL